MVESWIVISVMDQEGRGILREAEHSSGLQLLLDNVLHTSVNHAITHKYLNSILCVPDNLLMDSHLLTHLM